MAATTLPTLLLGADPVGPPAESYPRWAAAVDAACALVHDVAVCP